MKTRMRWMVVGLVMAVGLAPVWWAAWQRTPGDEARAAIVCPADLTATTGTINSIKVFGDDGRTGRHHGVVINGTVTAGGAFECTIPYLNGQLRLVYVNEVAANPMGTAGVAVTAVYDSNASVSAVTAGTLSSGAVFMSTGAETGNPTSTNAMMLMGAAKITISSATAGGKFTLVLIARVTG